jgi:hypothetical protein
LKDDLMGRALEREDTSNDRDEEDSDDEDEDEEYSPEIRRVKRSEDEDEDENEETETEKEPRRIAFSRDKDLQRYRSATRQQRAGGIESRGGEKRGQQWAGSRVDKDRSDRYSNARTGRDREDEIESDAEDDNSRVETRTNNRIDDRFVDPNNRQNEGPRFIPRKVPLGEQEERKEEGTQEWKRATSGYEEDRYQSQRQEPDSESREIPTSAAEREERAPEGPEVYVEPDEGPQAVYLDKLGGFGALGALKVIPVALFLALVVVLVLTFITESIPEFPGALTSSILIVTLIIYGAATLLKA